jgi:hypothetical protein
MIFQLFILDLVAAKIDPFLGGRVYTYQHFVEVGIEDLLTKRRIIA